jgi:spherulation-specific family 4 protein
MSIRAMDGSELVMPRLIVPAYFHPASRPAEWAWLAGQAAQVRLVVLNLANGPGTAPDAAVRPAVDRLHAAGVPVAGYVDTNYGQRPAGEALADLGRYLDWYQVTGVFFDRAPTGAEHVGHYAGLADGARRLGARVVALNHGTHPVEAYAQHADLLGTFEGPWPAYLDLAIPRWARSRPAAQFYHLPHSVPAGSFEDARWLAARRNAGCAYITDRGGPNPWDRLPAGHLGQQVT